MYGSQDPDKPPIDWETVKKIKASVHTRTVFNSEQCDVIEKKINNLVDDANAGKFRSCTVDRAPSRTKYFFGEGYTYGQQLNKSDEDGYKRREPGGEKLFPKGEVDPIPDWIKELIIKPLEIDGLIPKNWINSAVINDYKAGGCIVSHIDPPHIFERPILSVSFFSESALSFGCKFTFKPMKVSTPMAQVPVWRGCLLRMFGFAANEVTHCIRPEDTEFRRASIILRHVPDTAPRMDLEELAELRRLEEVKRSRYNNRWSSRYGRQQHDWRNPGSRQGTPENNDKSEGEIDDDEIEKERSPSIEILPRVQVSKRRASTQSISSPEMTRRHSASESPHKTKRQSFFKKEESGPSSSNSSSGEEENETPFYKNSRMRMDNYDNKSKRQSFPFARGRGYVKRPFFRHHGGGQTHYYPNPHNRRQHNYNSYDKSHQRHGSASPSPENKHSRRRRSYNHSGESRHHNESESSRYDKSISYQDKPAHKFDRSPSPSPSPARPRLASTVQKRGDSQEQRKRSSSRPSRSESRPSRSVSRPSRIDTRPGRADKHPKSNSSSPSSGPDIETASAARRKRFVFLPDANSASHPLTATNMASPGGLSFNSGVASSGPKREEGELTDSDSVTSEKRRAIADIEEKSIENRLKNLDKKRGNIPEKVSKEALEAAEFEEEIENLDRLGGETELKSQLREELDKLKELVKIIHEAEKGTQISALDIITREVKTKINADYETTQTILKMKLDQRKTILKNKLIRLKEEKERGGEEPAATSGAGRMEFRKLKKSKEFRRKGGHVILGEFEKRRAYESDEEKDVIGNAKKRIENKRLERKKQMKESKYMDKSRSSSRERTKKQKPRDSSNDDLQKKIAEQLQATSKETEILPAVKPSRSWSSDSEQEPSTSRKKHIPTNEQSNIPKKRSKSRSLGPEEKLQDYKALLEIRERMLKRMQKAQKSDSSPSPVREKKKSKMDDKQNEAVTSDHARNDSPSPPPSAKNRKKKSADFSEVPALLKTATDSPPRGRSPGKKVKVIKKKGKVAREKSSSSSSDNESRSRKPPVEITDKKKIPSMYKKSRKRSNSSSSSSSRSPSPLVIKKKIKPKPGRETSASPSPAKHITKKRKDSESKSKKKDASGSSSDESIQTKIDKLRAKINKHNRTSLSRAEDTAKNEKKPKQVESTNNIETKQKELFTNKNFHESSLVESHAKVEQKVGHPENVDKAENLQSDNEDITSGLLETKVRPRVKEEKVPKKRVLSGSVKKKKKKETSSESSDSEEDTKKKSSSAKKKKKVLSKEDQELKKVLLSTLKKKIQLEVSSSSDSSDHESKKVKKKKKKELISLEDKVLKKALLTTLLSKKGKMDSSSDSSSSDTEDEKQKVSKKKSKQKVAKNKKGHENILSKKKRNSSSENKKAEKITKKKTKASDINAKKKLIKVEKKGESSGSESSSNSSSSGSRSPSPLMKSKQRSAVRPAPITPRSAGNDADGRRSIADLVRNRLM